MRLIDADELEKIFEEILLEPDYQHAGENWSVGVGIAQTSVYDIPTAYDVEAVLNKLDNMRAKPTELVYDVPFIDHIIEIVRRGGVK